jgi:hypothetical protein
VPLIDVHIEPLNVLQVPPDGLPPIEGTLAPATQEALDDLATLEALTPAPAPIVPDLDPLPDPVPVPTPEPLAFRRRPSPILLPGS